MTRKKDLERLAQLAGNDVNGGILPPPPNMQIDRSPSPHWRNAVIKNFEMGDEMPHPDDPKRFDHLRKPKAPDNPDIEHLPEDRQAAFAQGMAQFQTISAERDAALKRNNALLTENIGLKVAVEALEAQRTELESRVRSAMLIRDQAVAERAVYESLFVSIQAQLRAFAVPAAPLVRDAEENDGGAKH